MKFLDKETILLFYQNLVETYGGKQGIRDDGLLESALAQPKAAFAGEYAHETIFQKAAAYGFHICRNHPFLDGNKRTALVAVYTFLFVNNYQLISDKKSLFAVMIDLAEGKIEKEELAKYLEKNVNKRKAK